MLNLIDLIRLCKSFQDMGSDITNAGEKFLDDPDNFPDLNQSALAVFTEWLNEVVDASSEFSLDLESSDLVEEFERRKQ